MENKHMKRCSTLLAIKEMEIKTTMWYHYTSIRMTTKGNTVTAPSAGKYEEKLDHSNTAGGNLKQ